MGKLELYQKCKKCGEKFCPVKDEELCWKCKGEIKLTNTRMGGK